MEFGDVATADAVLKQDYWEMDGRELRLDRASGGGRGGRDGGRGGRDGGWGGRDGGRGGRDGGRGGRGGRGGFGGGAGGQSKFPGT